MQWSYSIIVSQAVGNPNILKGLSPNCSILLVMKVANVVIAYLATATLKDDSVEFNCNENQFIAKEKSIIAFNSGYVFGRMYRRIHFS